MELWKAKQSVKRVCRTLVVGIAMLDLVVLSQWLFGSQPAPIKTLIAVNITAALIVGVFAASIRLREYLDKNVSNV